MNWSYESIPTEHTWYTPESSTTTLGGPSTREIEDLARQTADEIDRTVISLRGGAAGEVEAPAGLTSRGTLVAQHAGERACRHRRHRGHSASTRHPTTRTFPDDAAKQRSRTC